MSSNFSNTARLIGVCIWVILGFFVAQIMVIVLVGVAAHLGVLHASDINRPLIQLLLLAVGYSLALGIIVGLPCLFDSKNLSNSLKDQLGIAKKPLLKHFALSVLGFGVYIVLTILFSFIIQTLWQGFNANQTQEVGFQGLANVIEYIMAFVALVIIPPVVEELLFRGYLFGRLRQSLGFWSSALITSVLFGLVHLQWNVGVDVFALSLVLCFLREKTGAIWAGIGLHMIKNGVAYVFLFLQPDLLKHFL
jgi:membrane protease YdiL (CAAX protease family)